MRARPVSREELDLVEQAESALDSALGAIADVRAKQLAVGDPARANAARTAGNRVEEAARILTECFA